MAQKIEFDYEGEHYVLEFSRNICRQMEATGFKVTRIDEMPSILIPQLVEGAFMLHHKRMKKDKVDEIYKHVTRKDAFVQSLQEMYLEALTSLFDEPEENDPKKIEW